MEVIEKAKRKLKIAQDHEERVSNSRAGSVLNAAADRVHVAEKVLVTAMRKEMMDERN